ncbi:MAG: zf-TFIIB domain-containing protein [Myxococcota bacterium]|nr:zf-TFIIB domain-containing protein [Myxococcota bacterium]MEC8425244.1 zf-TFIIB domain-containing protein [Myxococcota bacterium]
MPACPICSAEMTTETRSGVTIDVCPEHGIWLDRKELMLITEAARHAEGEFVWADLFRSEASPKRNTGRALLCPHCSKTMEHELYKNVEIDWCRDHGVWLDNGELEAILNNLRLDGSYLRGVRLRLWDTRY